MYTSRFSFLLFIVYPHRLLRLYVCLWRLTLSDLQGICLESHLMRNLW
jgi:hypothetical protein